MGDRKELGARVWLIDSFVRWRVSDFSHANPRKPRSWLLRLVESAAGAGRPSAVQRREKKLHKQHLLDTRLCLCHQLAVNYFTCCFNCALSHITWSPWNGFKRVRVNGWQRWMSSVHFFYVFRSLNSTQGEIRVGPSHQVQITVMGCL